MKTFWQENELERRLRFWLGIGLIVLGGITAMALLLGS